MARISLRNRRKKTTERRKNWFKIWCLVLCLLPYLNCFPPIPRMSKKSNFKDLEDHNLLAVKKFKKQKTKTKHLLVSVSGSQKFLSIQWMNLFRFKTHTPSFWRVFFVKITYFHDALMCRDTKFHSGRGP